MKPERTFSPCVGPKPTGKSALRRTLPYPHPLTAEAQRAIDLLQERRPALISAAVTGQIDVRSSVALNPTKPVSSANR